MRTGMPAADKSGNNPATINSGAGCGAAASVSNASTAPVLSDPSSSRCTQVDGVWPVPRLVPPALPAKDGAGFSKYALAAGSVRFGVGLGGASSAFGNASLPTYNFDASKLTARDGTTPTTCVAAPPIPGTGKCVPLLAGGRARGNETAAGDQSIMIRTGMPAADKGGNNPVTINNTQGRCCIFATEFNVLFPDHTRTDCGTSDAGCGAAASVSNASTAPVLSDPSSSRCTQVDGVWPVPRLVPPALPAKDGAGFSKYALAAGSVRFGVGLGGASSAFGNASLPTYNFDASKLTARDGTTPTTCVAAPPSIRDLRSADPIRDLEGAGSATAQGVSILASSILGGTRGTRLDENYLTRLNDEGAYNWPVDRVHQWAMALEGVGVYSIGAVVEADEATLCDWKSDGVPRVVVSAIRSHCDRIALPTDSTDAKRQAQAT